jgi:hypothetical protein
MRLELGPAPQSACATSPPKTALSSALRLRRADERFEAINPLLEGGETPFQFRVGEPEKSPGLFGLATDVRSQLGSRPVDLLIQMRDGLGDDVEARAHVLVQRLGVPALLGKQSSEFVVVHAHTILPRLVGSVLAPGTASPWRTP